MTRRDIPNLISLLRILLVAPVVAALAEERFGLALALFGVAGVSDGLDGWLAKTFAWQSRLGAFLDPLADKLLLVASFLTLGWIGVVPCWLVALVLLRDLVIVAGAAAYHLVVGAYDAAPTVWSKLNTFMQIVYVLAVVAEQAFATELWVGGLIYVVALTTAVSGSHYVWIWSRRAWRAKHGGAV